LGNEAGKKARVSRVTAVAFVIAIVVLAAGLRFYRLYHHSLWNDEISSALASRYPVGTILSFFARADSSPPLFLLTNRMLGRLTGNFASRVFPAAFGVACVLLIMLIAGRLWGYTAALFAGLWLAVNPVSIFVSQEIRYPSLLTFLFLLVLWFAVRLAEKPSWQSAAALALASSAAIYTHYYSFIFVGLLGLYFLCVLLWSFKRAADDIPKLAPAVEASFFARDQRVRGFATAVSVGVLTSQRTRIRAALLGVAAVFAAFLSFVPFLKTFAYQLLRGVPLREPVGVVEFLARLFIGINIAHSPNDLPVLAGLLNGLYGNDPVHIVALLAVSLLLLLPAFYALFSRGRARWLLMTIGLGAIVALAVLTRRFPTFEPKYFSPFVPIFGLLWAAGMSRFKPPLQAAFAVLCVGGGLLSISDYYFDVRYERQNWRAVAAELTESVGENEAIGFYHLYKSPFLKHYMGFAAPHIYFISPKRGSYIGGTLKERERSIDENLKLLDNYDGLWLLVYHPYVFDPNGKAMAGLRQHGFYEVSRKCWSKRIRRFCFAHFVKGLDRAAAYFKPEIDFSSDNVLLSQIVEGIDEAEDGWAWMHEEGKVLLKRGVGRVCVKFFVNCDFLSCPISVGLYAEGLEIGNSTIDRSDIYTLCGEHRAESDPVSVRIVSSATFDPSKIYGGQSRELSILLSKIGWTNDQRESR